MSPEDARFAAMRKLGNVARVKEQTSEVWSIVWLEQLRQDENPDLVICNPVVKCRQPPPMKLLFPRERGG